MAEGQAWQDNTQQLQVQLQSHESQLRDAEQDRAHMAEQLEQALRNVRILTQEKDALWELQASLQMERNQLQCDIQDTVTMVRVSGHGMARTGHSTRWRGLCLPHAFCPSAEHRDSGAATGSPGVSETEPGDHQLPEEETC